MRGRDIQHPMRGQPRSQDVETGLPLRSRVAQRLSVLIGRELRWQLGVALCEKGYAFASSLAAVLREDQFEYSDPTKYRRWIPMRLCSRLALPETADRSLLWQSQKFPDISLIKFVKEG